LKMANHDLVFRRTVLNWSLDRRARVARVPYSGYHGPLGSHAVLPPAYDIPDQTSASDYTGAQLPHIMEEVRAAVFQAFEAAEKSG
jgi:hypothetical protein